MGHGGYLGSDPNTSSSPSLLGPVGGGRRAGVPGTPKHIPQNNPLVSLIILNTRVWGFLEKKSPLGGCGPRSQVDGGG